MLFSSESPTAAGRNARKENIPVITVFFGAGDRSVLPNPRTGFFLWGGDRFFFPEKRNGPLSPFSLVLAILRGFHGGPAPFGKAVAGGGGRFLFPDPGVSAVPAGDLDVPPP